LSLLVALSAGACLITTPSFDAGSSLAIMARERCTLVSGNDTMFLMMMAHPDFAQTKLALRGGWAAPGRGDAPGDRAHGPRGAVASPTACRRPRPTS
jgi:acyl-CoA synthetase (AMP-forming)/AMP-acid ligase II